MSFYNVENLASFTNFNPEALIQQNLRFIKRGYSQKSEITNSTTGNATILANELLAGYIIRTPTGVVTDTTDTAVNIYAALLRSLGSHSSEDFGILPGFNFDFCIYNEGSDTITLEPGAGVVFGVAPTFTVQEDKLQWFRATVTVANKTTPSIYISELGYYPILI
jgi:hypothetical protein